MIKVEVGELTIIQKDIKLEEVQEYAVQLAKEFNHINTSEADLEYHFDNEVYEYYEVYRGLDRVGNVYLSARKIGDQTFHTLDGYSDGGTFKEALQVSRWMIDKFTSENDDYFLFTAEEKKNAGAMVLVRRLGFKPILSNEHYVFYKYKGE